MALPIGHLRGLLGPCRVHIGLSWCVSPSSIARHDEAKEAVIHYLLLKAFLHLLGDCVCLLFFTYEVLENALRATDWPWEKLAIVTFKPDFHRSFLYITLVPRRDVHILLQKSVALFWVSINIGLTQLVQQGLIGAYAVYVLFSIAPSTRKSVRHHLCIRLGLDLVLTLTTGYSRSQFDGTLTFTWR